MELAAGQRWAYRSPEGFEDSRLVIGAIVKFDGRSSIICCSVTGAPYQQPDGQMAAADIPFIAISEPAFLDSVTTEDGVGELAPDFLEALQAWADDPRGITSFTVPFEGFLDRMIALQAAAILGKPAA